MLNMFAKMSFKIIVIENSDRLTFKIFRDHLDSLFDKGYLRKYCWAYHDIHVLHLLSSYSLSTST